MRIALVHPTNWPQVRRGTERFMNEMAGFLAKRGHHAKIICSKPGRREIHNDGGFIADYHRSLWQPWMSRAGIHPFHVFPLTTLTALASERFDVAHCFNFTDAYTASLLRGLTGTRVLLHLAAIPAAAGYRKSVSSGGALFRRAVQVSDTVITNGEVQADYFEKRFGTRPTVVKAPVDIERFRPLGSKNLARPIILSASALNERRKGGRFLMRAFNALKEEMPGAELHICGEVSDGVKQELLALVLPRCRGEVVFHAPEAAALEQLYSAASVLVLPSVWEAFPLVVLEALACGTPVVGTHDGGIPELVSTGGIGRTFDPGPLDRAEPTNVEGMVSAIVEAAALNNLPETSQLCRQAASRFDWSVLGPLYEAIYRDLGDIQRQ
ncbi:MAG: glycosyltransferase family 4 protein [Terriglobia bacterium]